jgi:hypothetical protein
MDAHYCGQGSLSLSEVDPFVRVNNCLEIFHSGYNSALTKIINSKDEIFLLSGMVSAIFASQ